ncbi:HAD family hydrolase [Limimaricola sp. G21655-S1]|uniref:HAD family hydrolase n=1 Tax=Limimaricola sp. G21655-S1 TaxID=3014768 RepID=UPI0022AF5D83|nr:HAD family hydrolase [Limimaricola sp. G21655-S1]MCZ4260372.1 HAD family hydrolase [Limimaricola sp. G21655-S1]
MKPTALIFDKDGTLFDFHATWGGWSRGLIEAEAEGDPVRIAAIAAALGYDLETERFAPDSLVIASTTAEIADAMLPHLPGCDRRALIARMNARAAEAPQVPAVPLAPLFAKLAARGVALGLVTNDSEAPARAHIGAAGLAAAFGFVAGADSGFGFKPGPGQLLACAEALGAAPDACAMIGDSLHDLKAARAAGMMAVAVLTGLAPRDALAPHADLVLDDIGALPDWLDAGGITQA